MKTGKLYGIGVGPGDPELLTVKGSKILGNCMHLFVPKARIKAESAALSIIKSYVPQKAEIHELVFPMTDDEELLSKRWSESANSIAKILKSGEDACFVTLGDTYLYSTYIYLVRALRSVMPEVTVETIPGVTAFSAAAALTNFTVGEGREPVTIVPTGDDLEIARRAIGAGGTVVLMKIGKRLSKVIDMMEELGVIDDAVFISNVGLEKERIETDLRKLKSEGPETGYLSLILLHTNGSKK